MNKILVICAVLLLSALKVSAQDLIVKGKLSLADTLQVRLTDGINVDTLVTNNGEFYFKRKPGRSLAYAILAWPVHDKNHKEFYKKFFVEKGEVTIMDSAVTMTYPEYEDKFDEFAKWNDPLIKLREQISKVRSGNPAIADQRITRATSLLIDKLQIETAKAFVLANTDNIISAYVFGEYLLPGIQDAALLDSIYNCIDAKFRDTRIMRLIAQAIEGKKNTRSGQPVLSFSATTSTGKQFSLSSLKGKYVLLDFWGTWCPPCVAGFPRMKIYHDKYAGKIEFVGIACRDDEKALRAAIRKYQLDWTQILNHETVDGIQKKYAIDGGFPAKVLIDPQGRLVQLYHGETNDLYDKLDELFNVKD
ncbi:thiol-disulfide isomerase/thioredoxin [Mucilaginibacter gracilis]|uniref:Thiol-disulfide isomerase/thioredoxin n=1 Tax=Mucilaginibacter gracilis TaxID=423350 RepID=A0A495IVU5_9SPHI|nr:TlpA disulfide reductase family protein [Mucilaginibacter gracilis]RKR79989.1 thiol-disulfide isomerase/thioredoxin [Mucilaginibacter gracilis]